MSTQALIYQPQLSSFYGFAVYLLYAIVTIGFLMILTRQAISLETLGIGALVFAVICYAVYIRYQRITFDTDQIAIHSAGLNPLDVLLPRTLKLSELSEVNAIRMLPKDLRGERAIPTYIEFKDKSGRTIVFNRWNYAASEITRFLQSLAAANPNLTLNDDIQFFLKGS